MTSAGPPLKHQPDNLFLSDIKDEILHDDMEDEDDSLSDVTSLFDLKEHWYKAQDGAVFSLRTEKNLLSPNSLRDLGLKRLEELQAALAECSLQELLEEGYVEDLGETSPTLVPDLVEVEVFSTPGNSKVFVLKGMIVPTKEPNKELINLMRSSNLVKLIQSGKLQKAGEVSIHNPSMGDTDNFMQRNRLVTSEFFFGSDRIPLVLDRYKRIIQSEYVKETIDYEEIQELLKLKSIDDLLCSKILKIPDVAIDPSCDPYFMRKTTMHGCFRFETSREGARIVLNRKKEIPKGLFKKKGVNYKAIQKKLRENSIDDLLDEGYLIELEDKGNGRTSDKEQLKQDVRGMIMQEKKRMAAISSSESTKTDVKEEATKRNEKVKEGLYPKFPCTCIKRKKRIQRCNQCDGCRRENCGFCYRCLDMVRFGGPGLMKQRCEQRTCKFLRCPECRGYIKKYQPSLPNFL